MDQFGFCRPKSKQKWQRLTPYAIYTSLCRMLYTRIYESKRFQSAQWIEFETHKISTKHHCHCPAFISFRFSVQTFAVFISFYFIFFHHFCCCEFSCECNCWRFTNIVVTDNDETHSRVEWCSQRNWTKMDGYVCVCCCAVHCAVPRNTSHRMKRFADLVGWGWVNECRCIYSDQQSTEFESVEFTVTLGFCPKIRMTPFRRETNQFSMSNWNWRTFAVPRRTRNEIRLTHWIDRLVWTHQG